ncbi:MAG: hypothetical protein ACI9DF_005841, partial [Verrucomicrobiales bacterium]
PLIVTKEEINFLLDALQDALKLADTLLT